MWFDSPDSHSSSLHCRKVQQTGMTRCSSDVVSRHVSTQRKTSYKVCWNWPISWMQTFTTRSYTMINYMNSMYVNIQMFLNDGGAVGYLKASESLSVSREIKPHQRLPCFLELETLLLFLSTGCFQEWI